MNCDEDGGVDSTWSGSRMINGAVVDEFEGKLLVEVLMVASYSGLLEVWLELESGNKSLLEFEEKFEVELSTGKLLLLGSTTTNMFESLLVVFEFC